MSISLSWKKHESHSVRMPLFQNKNPDKDLRQQREQIIKRTVSSFNKLSWPKSTTLRSFEPDLFWRSANIIIFNTKSHSRMEVILLKCFHWRSKYTQIQAQQKIFIQSDEQSWLYLHFLLQCDLKMFASVSI